MSKILVISPHPDDSEIGLGGTIRRHVTSGEPVDVLYLTAGERGCPGMTPQETAILRMEEAKVACATLGAGFLGCWYLPDESLEIDDVIRENMTELCHKYDLVYVTNERESHPDHRNAGRLVREALKQLDNPPECLQYEVWTPLQKVDRVVDITPFLDVKRNAMNVHTSQMTRQSFADAAIGLNRYRGVMNGRCEYAEAFMKMRLNGAEGMKIALMLLTYSPSVEHPRAQYAYTTLKSTLDNINVGPNNSLHVHIADDGSDPAHVQKLIAIANKKGYEPTVTNAQRGGYGKSYNLACQALHDSHDLILPLEDDWQLMRPLKLEYLVKALDENPDIRSIRLGYLGITQPLKGTVAFRSGMTYLLLDPNSDEPHVFCGHPRLETVEYERDIGPWPEGIRAGETEWEITHRRAARIGVAWPLDINLPASQDWGSIFAHIGSVSFNQDIPEGAHA